MSADVRWILYLAREQDATRLAGIFSELTRELLGFKWKPNRTTKGSKKRDPYDPQKLIQALHIEGPADRAYDICSKLSKW
jgi:hypothetical protein